MDFHLAFIFCILMSITSSNSNRNCTKLRIVFLGDQGVGKSSIIDRYTTNRFDDTHNVPQIAFSQPSVSISMSEISVEMVKFSDFRCGIRQDRSGTVVWSQRISKTRIVLCSSMMLLLLLPSKIFAIGTNYSSNIKEHPES